MMGYGIFLVKCLRKQYVVLMNKINKIEPYEHVFNVFDVVYSVNDRVVKLCNYNDQGLLRPLTTRDILTAITCYPKDASVVMCIR